MFSKLLKKKKHFCFVQQKRKKKILVKLKMFKKLLIFAKKTNNMHGGAKMLNCLNCKHEGMNNYKILQVIKIENVLPGI